MAKLAIFAISPNVISETFIRNHIERIGLPVLDLYGKDWGLSDSRGKYYFPAAFRAFGNALQTYSTAASYRLWCLAVARLLIKNGITHVLAEFGVTGAYLYKVTNRIKIPLVVHFHGYDAFAKPTLSYYGRFYSEMFLSSKALIAVSDSMKRQLINLGAPQAKVFTIPCGVDEYEVMSRSNQHRFAQKFVCLGRFVEKKGHYLTILAFSMLLNEFPSAKLSLIGNGPLLGLCKKLVDSLHLNASVEFYGALSWPLGIEVMAKHDIFLQHSITSENGDREGSPVALVEAQILGLPCVATMHEGIQEIVSHNLNGLLCEEGNVDMMSDFMAALLRDHNLYTRLASNTTRLAVQRYHLRGQLSKLRSVILE